jgi:FlaA1/EpsC-like NDP-sugar epimerase
LSGTSASHVRYGPGMPTPCSDRHSASIYTSPVISNIDWRDFLARPLLASPPPQALSALRGLPILITGAGGSIASELTARLATAEARLILLESSESRLFALQRKIAPAQIGNGATFVLGSVTDESLLDETFSVHRPLLVFHAAAFKQVPLLEEQPLAAISNNIFGTASLIDASSSAGARVVLLSTDKAVEPASVMGAAKRVAEHLVREAQGTALRLGNVLASRDSVAEVFAHQIAGGGPLTVTHREARRYFLTIEEAAGLLLSVATETRSPALLAPRLLSPHRIAALAQFMIRQLASGRDLEIVYTGLRAGDKESESLWSAVETASPSEAAGLYRIESPSLATHFLARQLRSLHAAVGTRDILAALDTLRRLVPDYTPSTTVRAVCPQVPHE